MKQKQKLITGALAILLALCMCTPVVYAQPAAADPASGSTAQSASEQTADSSLQSTHGRGHITNTAEVYDNGRTSMKAQEADLPTKYDPRKEYWYKNSVQVRNQADTELCWAFAPCQAAQISYAKETNSAQGLLSPCHLGYFFYNRVNDPLGGTAKDKNKTKKYSWLYEGGNVSLTMQHMATWSGLGAEENTPFTVDTDDLTYNGPISFDKSLAYNSQLLEENSVYYKRLPYNSEGIATLKQMVYDYGAAVVSMEFDDHTFMNSETAAFYKYDDYNKNDHEVTIVGWDDKYSRSNFGSDSTGVKPKKNGAWIVLNTWGGEEAWPQGDNGYCYVSYESTDIMSDGICAFDMREAKAGLHNFQYDGNAADMYLNVLAGDTAANVYTVPEGKQMKLTDIGFTSWTYGEVNYSIDVYTGLTSADNPDNGIHASHMEVTTDTAGCKTFKLTDPVTLGPGETYSIVIRFPQKARFGVELSDKKNGYVAGLASGQSFLKDVTTCKWEDTYTNSPKYCFRIKGIAEDMTCKAHDYQAVEVTPAQKGVYGHTIYQCTDCGHMIRDDFTGMLSPKPEKTKIVSLKKGKKKMTVKVKKNAELIAGEHIDGYQIRYSLKKNMKSSKTVMAKGYRTVSKKITNLKPGKKYYVQVRCRHTLNGKTYTSSWSAKKAVIIPKN